MIRVILFYAMQTRTPQFIFPSIPHRFQRGIG